MQDSILYFIIHSFSFYREESKNFLRFVTGSPYPAANSLQVHFHSDPSLSVFSASTCGKQLTLSTCVCDDMEDLFVVGLRSVISSWRFTMP